MRVRDGAAGEWSYPVGAGDLADLELVTLQANALAGAFPVELGRLANLKRLLLGVNLLSGRVPPELGNVAGLTALDLPVSVLVDRESAWTGGRRGTRRAPAPKVGVTVGLPERHSPLVTPHPSMTPFFIRTAICPWVF